MQCQEEFIMEGKDYFKKGQRALIRGNLEECAMMLTEALKREYEPVKTLLSRGATYLITHDLTRALRDFDYVLEIDGNNERAFYYRAITHLRKNEHRQAIGDLDEALSRNPHRGAAYFARGVAWTMLDRQDKAVADFERAVALADSETQSYLNILGSDPELLGRFVNKQWVRKDNPESRNYMKQEVEV